jgi:hypothetical protein
MPPQAPCPKQALHGTPRDLTLPLPAVRVQPQCSKRGAMPARPLVRAMDTAALCEAGVHNPTHGVAAGGCHPLKLSTSLRCLPLGSSSLLTYVTHHGTIGPSLIFLFRHLKVP